MARFGSVERSCGCLDADSLRLYQGTCGSSRMRTYVVGADQPRARPRRPRAGCSRARGSPIPGGGAAARAPSRPSRARAAAGGGWAPLPGLGTTHGRALAPRARDPRRRSCHPARAGHTPAHPGERGSHVLQGAEEAPGPRARPSRPTVDRIPGALHCCLHGAIAQLGERLDRTQEVGGSSPPSSIGRRPIATRGCSEACSHVRSPSRHGTRVRDSPSKTVSRACRVDASGTALGFLLA